VPRYAGLVNIDVLDNVVHRMLASPQDFHDAEPSRISQGLERLYMHRSTYVLPCIYNVKTESLRNKEVSCELVVIRRTLQDSKRRRKPVEVL